MTNLYRNQKSRWEVQPTCSTFRMDFFCVFSSLTKERPTRLCCFCYAGSKKLNWGDIFSYQWSKSGVRPPLLTRAVQRNAFFRIHHLELMLDNGSKARFQLFASLAWLFQWNCFPCRQPILTGTNGLSHTNSHPCQQHFHQLQLRAAPWCREHFQEVYVPPTKFQK